MQHLEKLRQRLREACDAVGRDPTEVRILAVGKKHPAEKLRELYALGQRAFGENMLQEALEKQRELADLAIEWHFIGHIQSNKTRPIAELFAWVQSVDRAKILDRLSTQRPENLPPLNLCLQVNIDREPQKSGVLPEELPALARLAQGAPRIALRGLMAIPRPSDDPGTCRDSFRRVKALYDDLCELGFALDTLSMGMSGDLEHAVAEGSTMIRVGTDLFGPRP